jgi:hypothetical protein
MQKKNICCACCLFILVSGVSQKRQKKRIDMHCDCDRVMNDTVSWI